jgi:hypothetical protein
MILKPLLIPILLATPSLLLGQGIYEDFDSRTAGETLPAGASSGWRQELPRSEQDGLPGSAIVRSDEDYNLYLSLTQRQTFVAYGYGEPAPLWEMARGPAVFRMDFRLRGEMPIDILLDNGRTTAGFKIVIHSGQKFIALSDRGETSTSQSMNRQFELPHLKTGVWYTLEIRDIQLSNANDSPVEGRLYLYEQGEPVKLLLDGLVVRSAGPRPFDQIHMLQIRRWGNSQCTLDLDNIILEEA